MLFNFTITFSIYQQTEFRRQSPDPADGLQDSTLGSMKPVYYNIKQTTTITEAIQKNVVLLRFELETKAQPFGDILVLMLCTGTPVD